ncbi:MAG: hypothetical protein JSV35_05730 [Candidatus Bathyarchaeota archaeon]|nr:MAG: hypothetical protein JSV35_05730 [Candidatus Bathyarchaeota archaeon]
MWGARRIAIAIVFGVLIFLSKSLIPSPINKMLIVFQALLLALSSLMLRVHARGFGATLTGLVGGCLTAMWDISLAPFSLIFALLFGLLVDGLFFAFGVDGEKRRVDAWRIVAGLTLATAIVGFSSYYTTTHLTGVIPRNIGLEVAILAMGTFNGAVAGYLTSVIWNRYRGNFSL